MLRGKNQRKSIPGAKKREIIGNSVPDPGTYVTESAAADFPIDGVLVGM